MSNFVKITELPALETPDANTENSVFIIVDRSTGTDTTKQISLGNVQASLVNESYITAAFDLANSTNTHAEAAFELANTTNITADLALTTSEAAFDLANTNTLHAEGAFDLANTLSGDLANATVYIETAPADPLGQAGDEKGQIFLGNTEFYYCTSDYDGVTNIWSKITSTDSW